MRGVPGKLQVIMRRARRGSAPFSPPAQTSPPHPPMLTLISPPPTHCPRQPYLTSATQCLGQPSHSTPWSSILSPFLSYLPRPPMWAIVQEQYFKESIELEIFRKKLKFSLSVQVSSHRLKIPENTPCAFFIILDGIQL